MRLLGIDYGGKRIGIAKSDEAGVFAHGLGFFGHRSDDEDVSEIVKLVAQYDIGIVVIGYPVNMNGSKGVQAEKVERLAEKLKISTSAEIKLWDERLSSKEAERYLIEQDTSRKKRKRKVDQLAAQIILQAYMDSQRKG